MTTTREFEYTVEGARMVGILARPDGVGKRPAVLIAHEGNGLDDYQKARAERFAELGYVAFALDYHGDGMPLDDPDLMMARLGALGNDPQRLEALANAGLDVLLAEPRADAARVGAVGYCFGGTLVLELARSGADLKAVVGMHPGLTTWRPQDSPNIAGKVLVCVGSEDSIIPIEQRAAFEADMRAAGVDWTMIVYGGAQHSFTHPHSAQAGLPGLAYDADADRRSWRAMLDLFDEALGPPN
jgi:dienelactone hydrolase